LVCRSGSRGKNGKKGYDYQGAENAEVQHSQGKSLPYLWTRQGLFGKVPDVPLLLPQTRK
jgi:hypothetical protein